ncbi:MAG: hypothetical protein GXY16_04595 [Syntrophomonadaceae bacterium]|nr:hypothetical protein [Syntrophomonadaceae bacterium]
MNLFLKCPVCEGDIDMKERYCGMCGFDSVTIVDPLPENDDDNDNSLKNKAACKNITKTLLVIMLMVLLQLSAGGIYWWVKEPATIAQCTENQSTNEADNSFNTVNNIPDLTKAEAYIPNPGISARFYQRYPYGEAGVIERVSANILVNQDIVSEVDLIEHNGEFYGYAYHFLTQSDGVYIIADQKPEDIIPLLKNNLRPGLKWEYHDGARITKWTVMEIGKTVDLGFITLHNCLLVLEDCNEADYKKIIYYAPGIGRVMEKSSPEGEWIMIMTALSSINPDQAAKTIKSWSVNYEQI